MKQIFIGKTRLVLTIAVCVIFIAVSFSCAASEPLVESEYVEKKVNTVNKPSDTPERPRPLAFPRWFYKIFNNDWNYWSNPPDMYAIPDGNVGIGTTSPTQKLEVHGGASFMNGNVGIGTTTPAEKLDVSGSINASPVVGKWTQTQTRSGNGNYIWDVQLFNTNPQYLNWTVGSDHITIKKVGYYQINVNVLQYTSLPERGDVYVKRNNQVSSASLGYVSTGENFFNHHITDVVYFNVGDIVNIYSSSSSGNVARYGDGNLLTTLSIVRLN